MSDIKIVVESGSDMPPELAEKYGIYIVPMHVTFGNETKDDGFFDPQEVIEYYNRTGEVPKTSGSNTEDFNRVFDKIHSEFPDAQILYIAYSAVTTVSYGCAMAAMEGRDYIQGFDTKMVTIGQALIALHTAKEIRQHPDWTIAQAKQEAERIAAITHMSFLPRNLNFLRAGGRCSNAAALIGGILHIVPQIDILDGKLVAVRKYHGAFPRVIGRMMKDYAETYHLSREQLYVVLAPGFDERMRNVIESTADSLGFKDIVWMKTGGVITSHGGTGAFGIAGVEGEA